METLKLNDGTVMENSYALMSSNTLFVYCADEGMTLSGFFALLIDSGNTEKIVYTKINGTEIEFDGFDRLMSVRDEDNGMFTAVLIKE